MTTGQFTQRATGPARFQKDFRKIAATACNNSTRVSRENVVKSATSAHVTGSGGCQSGLSWV
jgi:hypothetical protein